MQRKVINYQVLIEILCCFLFAGIMDHLIVTSKYKSYVTPKMVPYFYFLEIVMFIWAEAGVFRLFKPQYKFRLFHCYVLVIPILLLIFFNGEINSADLVLNYSGNDVEHDLIHSHNHNHTILITGVDNLNKTIFVKDEEFSGWLHELSVYGEKYIGYDIRIKGFIFRDENKMKDDEFLTCRLQMSCCAQDLTPVGVITKYEKAKDLTLHEWVEVYGTLEMSDKGLYIEAINISKAKKPVNEYVYPVE